MSSQQVPLDLLSLRFPLQQARGSLRLRIRIEGDTVEVLQQSDQEEGHLVVSKLLTEADPGTCIEGKENERIRNEVLLHSLVDEPVRIKFVRIRAPQVLSTVHDDGCE